MSFQVLLKVYKVLLRSLSPPQAQALDQPAWASPIFIHELSLLSFPALLIALASTPTLRRYLKNCPFLLFVYFFPPSFFCTHTGLRSIGSSWPFKRLALSPQHKHLPHAIVDLLYCPSLLLASRLKFRPSNIHIRFFTHLSVSSHLIPIFIKLYRKSKREFKPRGNIVFQSVRTCWQTQTQSNIAFVPPMSTHSPTPIPPPPLSLFLVVPPSFSLPLSCCSLPFFLSHLPPLPLVSHLPPVYTMQDGKQYGSKPLSFPIPR
jgi:hypothetical protein